MRKARILFPEVHPGNRGSAKTVLKNTGCNCQKTFRRIPIYHHSRSKGYMDPCEGTFRFAWHIATCCPISIAWRPHKQNELRAKKRPSLKQSAIFYEPGRTAPWQEIR